MAVGMLILTNCYWECAGQGVRAVDVRPELCAIEKEIVHVCVAEVEATRNLVDETFKHLRCVSETE